MSLRVRRAAPRGAVAFAVMALVATTLTLTSIGRPESADAGVHDESSETRYREVWIDHSQFRGIHDLMEVEQPPPAEGEPEPDPVFECGYTGQKWFAEPTNRCPDYRPMEFDLPSLNGVTRAEIFLDLWRAREPGNADFRINGNRYAADAGDDWSRTPTLVDIDVDDLDRGENELTLLSASAYHLHDAAVRVYDAAGSYPDGAGITSVSPAPVDGVLTVSEDETITLTADVTGADAVEFIAYYDGFDRDNDGERIDWQSFTRNNWHPGRSNKDGGPPSGEFGTIGHIGTVRSNGTVIVDGSEVDNSRGGVSGSTYTIEFDTAFVPDGSPLRFKVRALNEAGNDGFWVVDALGGATDQVVLARDDFSVDYVVIEDFQDDILHHASAGEERTRPDARTRDIRNVDLTDMVSVHLIHNYWDRPEVHVNPTSASTADRCGNGPSERVEDDWLTSVMDVTDRVVEGTNEICYEHVSGFGVFIEKPGPMFVIRRDPDLAPTVDAGEPYLAQVGVPITLVPTITDDDDSPVTVTWSGAGADFAGTENDERAQVGFASVGTFEVQVEVTDGSGATVADTATVTVSETPPPPTTLPPDPGDPGDPDALPTGGADVGYWMGDGGGEIYGFGDAGDPGAVTGQIVAVASTPTGSGLWVLTSDGVVHTFDGATDHGDVDLATLNAGEQPASLSVLPDGSGYWVFTDRGRAIEFGAAADLEDLVDQGVSPFLQGLIVDSAATASGEGAFMVAADGGVFAIGDAVFAGSVPEVVAGPLNGPVVGVATDPDGEGYWLVADDGGIFAFAADFQGSMGGLALNAPMVGAVAFGDGYLMVAADGGIFNFSDQQFLGSLGDDPPANPVSAVAGFPT